MRRDVWLAVALSVAPVLPASADVTGGTHAFLAISPQHPRVDEACRVRVSMRTKNGYALRPQRVTVVGDMTGHAMRPVEGELRRVPNSDDFEGTLAFTMRGPWRLTVNVEEGANVLAGVASIDVVGLDGDTGGPEIRLLVDLLQPQQGSLLPPGWVAIGVVAATAMMYATAVVLTRRRTSRAFHSHAAFASTTIPRRDR